MGKIPITGFKLFQLAPGIHVVYSVTVEGTVCHLDVFTHRNNRQFRLDAGVPWLDVPNGGYIAAVVLDAPTGNRWKVGEISMVGNIITFFTHEPSRFVPPGPPPGTVRAA